MVPLSSRKEDFNDHHLEFETLDRSTNNNAFLSAKGGYIYSRLGNPTCEQVECIIKGLEGGAGCMSFSSGMAAVCTAISGILRPGDHVVSTGTAIFAKNETMLVGFVATVVLQKQTRDFQTVELSHCSAHLN